MAHTRMSCKRADQRAARRHRRPREKRTSPRGQPAVRERGDRDEAGAEQPRADVLPRRGCRSEPAIQHRKESEHDRPERDAAESSCEEQVERASLDEEADARQNADGGGDTGDDRVERRAARRGARTRSSASRWRRRAPSRREQADEQDLAEEPRAVALSARDVHALPCRHGAILPIRGTCPSASSSSTTIHSRETRWRRCSHSRDSTSSGEAEDGATRSRRPRRCGPTSCCST